MSWLFSQALVVEYSAENSLDGEQSVPLSAMLTPQQFWRNDKMMDCSKPSLFGLTLQHLTESRGAELLTLFLAGFPVRTLAAQEEAKESAESAADCGQSLPGLLAKYDPVTHLLRTAQCSLFGDLTECYVTLPRWGLMRDGELYLPPTVALPMRGSESGLWPTPQTRGFTNDGDLMMLARSCGNYQEMSAMAYRAADKKQKRYWLTPRATDTGAGEKQETFLARMGDRTDRCAQSLPAQVNNPKTWPTPTVCGNLGSGAIQRRKEKGKQIGLSQSVSDTSGALNPPWVEWLMGWPIGWTDLKLSEMDKFHAWRQQHFAYLAND
jgi:hypothetical protein